MAKNKKSGSVGGLAKSKNKRSAAPRKDATSVVGGVRHLEQYTINGLGITIGYYTPNPKESELAAPVNGWDTIKLHVQEAMLRDFFGKPSEKVYSAGSLPEALAMYGSECVEQCAKVHKSLTIKTPIKPQPPVADNMSTQSRPDDFARLPDERAYRGKPMHVRCYYTPRGWVDIISFVLFLNGEPFIVPTDKTLKNGASVVTVDVYCSCANKPLGYTHHGGDGPVATMPP